MNIAENVTIRVEILKSQKLKNANYFLLCVAGSTLQTILSAIFFNTMRTAFTGPLQLHDAATAQAFPKHSMPTLPAEQLLH